MSPELLPLWQLLIEAGKRPLSCPECYLILEYLADTLPHNENGFNPAELHEAIDKHLSTCPDCHHYYQQQIDELKAQIKKEE